MGEHGKSIGKELDVVTGNEYNLEGKVEKGFKNTYGKIEKVVNRDLFNSKIGLIPTKENPGVIGFYDGAERGGEKPYLAKYTSQGLIDENGVMGVDAELTSLTKENLEEANEKDPNLVHYGNGVGNTKKDVAEGAINGGLNPEDIETLKSGGTVYKVIIHNPTNGLPTDLVESGIGMAGILFGSSYNTKDLEEIIKKNPDILNNTMFHSQGTIKATQAVSNLIKEGKLDPSKINLTYAGSPVNQSVAEKGIGKNIKYLNNPWDPVAFLNLGKSTVKDEKKHPVINYNINFEKDEDTGDYKRPNDLKVGGKKDGGKITVKVDKLNGKDTRTTWKKLYDNFTKKKEN